MTKADDSSYEEDDDNYLLTTIKPNTVNTTESSSNSEGNMMNGPMELEWKNEKDYIDFVYTLDIREKQVLDILESQFNYYMALAFSYDQLMVNAVLDLFIL